MAQSGKAKVFWQMAEKEVFGVELKFQYKSKGVTIVAVVVFWSLALTNLQIKSFSNFLQKKLLRNFGKKCTPDFGYNGICNG